jgi:hypothetical protein
VVVREVADNDVGIDSSRPHDGEVETYICRASLLA